LGYDDAMNLTLAEVQSAVGRLLGYSRTYASMLATEQADVDEAIRRGFRRFWTPPPIAVGPGVAYPHVWSFSRMSHTIAFTDPYTTGTITATGGAVTITGGSWPSWASYGTLVVMGERRLVKSRVSASVIQLEDASFASGSILIPDGSEFTLLRERYLMPDDFSGIDEFRMYGRNDEFTPIRVVSESCLRSARRDVEACSDGMPKMVAMVPVERSNVTNWLLWFHPVGRAGRIVELTYIADPPSTTSPAAFKPGGGPRHAETLLEAILSVAEEHVSPTQTRHRELFYEQLAGSIAFDRQVQRAPSAGMMNNSTLDRPTHDDRPHSVDLQF
jgi:hypothetical protein